MRTLWCACVVAACGSGSHATIDAPDAPGTASVRLIGFNDFHGALEPGTGAPGVAALAAEIASRRTPNTVIVSAGDLIGGSPLVSGLFHDEPTIDVMNAIGLDYNAVGNHEFDEGNTELQRMQHGGCHPVDGCGDGVSFAGASFHFLAANVRDQSGQTIFPAYEIRDVGGAKIAFVGMTLKGTPMATLASGITELSFADEVATMNALVPEIHAAGAQLIVLLIHQGYDLGSPLGGCASLSGALVDLVPQLDSSVIWVASAHSHKLYDCMIGGRPVTQADAHGDALTVVDLVVDVPTQTVTSIVATNVIVDAAASDPGIAALVGQWVQRAAPVGDRVVGTITADMTNSPNASGEVELGDVIADAMLAATSAGGAQVSLMNPGGIRDSFAFAKTGPETVDGQVRYREAFSVQPFSNNVFTVTLSGTDLAAALDTGAKGTGAAVPLQVAGLTYTWHPAAAPGSHVTVADVMVGGSPLVATASYRVTVNSIVGDPVNTPSMANATNPVGYGVDLDLLTAYIAAQSPLAPPVLNRITEN
jgi:5'-nucleotidase